MSLPRLWAAALITLVAALATGFATVRYPGLVNVLGPAAGAAIAVSRVSARFLDGRRDHDSTDGKS